MVVEGDEERAERVLRQLRELAEMRQRGDLTTTEFDTLKAECLRAVSGQGSGVVPQSGPMLRESVDLASGLSLALALSAGDLHRAVLAELRPTKPRVDARQRAFDQVSNLISRGHLNTADLRPLHQVIDTVCNDAYDTRIAEGHQAVRLVADQVRRSMATSNLAKAIVSIAQDSANSVIEGHPYPGSTPALDAGQPQRNSSALAETPFPADDAANTEGAQTMRSPKRGVVRRAWAFVREDTLGAVIGAGAAGSVVSVGSLPVATAIATALGPIGIGALVLGAAVLSGGLSSDKAENEAQR
jgi:hypothetical protein